ncbi:MAG: hypothetical protein HY877_08650 [Deltaproteobacteria bacterium]|nr:hypothetical protein [Deltaproteobacteria bacterium]
MTQKTSPEQSRRMTWEEMKKAFPDEWLMITDSEHDNLGRFIAGVVERHSKDDQEVFRLPIPKKNCAFRYTGESTFRGIFSHAEHDCVNIHLLNERNCSH